MDSYIGWVDKQNKQNQIMKNISFKLQKVQSWNILNTILWRETVAM